MIGIDISKDSLSTTSVDPVTRQTLWYREVPNTQEGLNILFQLTPEGTSWVIEPTGSYSTKLVKQAHQAGQKVLLAPTKQAKAFNTSLHPRAKCDRLDATGLALFALSRPLNAYLPKEPEVEKLDQLLSARKILTKSLTRLTSSRKELALAEEPLGAACQALKEQVARLDAEIAAVTKAPEFQLVIELQKVHGIGPVTAACVGSRLLSKVFTSPDQFVAYIGLDVSTLQSGKRRGDRGLTKRGDAEIRRLLYVSAMASVRAKDSPFAMQYERELTKGLSRTAALNAVARKLAKLCWAMQARGGSYDPARVYHRPTNTTKTATTT